MPNAQPKLSRGRPKLAATKTRVCVSFPKDVLERALSVSLAADVSLSGYICKVMERHLKRAKV
jgi:hypothetical protein